MRKKIYAIILVFILCFNLCGCEKIVTDIKKLEKINKGEDICNFWFPEEIKKETIVGFIVENTFMGALQYCLELKYDQEEFDKEITRLNEEMYSSFAYREYGILFYDDKGLLFNFPTYIYDYYSGHKYQYIVTDVEQRIIAYIFTFQEVDEIVFNTKYLPKNFDKYNKDEMGNKYKGGPSKNLDEAMKNKWLELFNQGQTKIE